MNQAPEAGETDRPAREGMSAFSGLAVLCIPVAAMAATTFIASGGSAQTPHQYSSPPPAFRRDLTPVESTTIYLLDSEAQLEEIRELVELAADQVTQMPLQHYPRVVTLLAGTPDEEAVAYARIVEQVRSGQGAPLSIDVVDLRAQKPK